jgi:hypothetical protein
MAKTDIAIAASPGSRALKNAKYERYCRLRASAQPRIPAYREAGWETSHDDDAYSNACRLERRPELRDRIAYLTRQAEELIAEKRQRIEERLWAIHGANIQDFFTTEDQISPTETTNNPVEIANNPDQQKVRISPRARVVPRPLTELDPETAKLIEDVTVDSKGRLIPKLYSKTWANAELRKMLNIGGQKELEQTDLSRLSDAELIQQLADQAKELGIEIDLNYTFAQSKKTDE